MLINVNGISIDYRDQGAGVPVIFIHAFPLNQTMWDDQLAVLHNRCRIITLDLRGFGQSDAPQGPYLMDQMAADVRVLMSALGIDRAVLVGLSMGGYVSLAFSRNYPDSVHALVLADTRASADTHESRIRRLKSAERAEREGARVIAEDMIPLLLGRTTLESRPSVVARVRAMIESNSPLGIAGAQRAMAERRDSTYILPGIDFPVMIVVGSEDTLTPVTEAESLRSGIRGARLRVIEGAGHLSNMERPEEFNSALLEFIELLTS
ncbi:MAG TPA: alpha/beta hydrolase [Blastocatellia bacterium]|nr:alpha/beta hydrolase [Blastocatellia bacterium]